MTNVNEKISKNRLWLIIGAVVLAMIVMIMFIGDIETVDTTYDIQPTNIQKIFSGTEPAIIAESFVNTQLTSPSTADHGSRLDATITHLGEHEYSVVNYVDSQNGFGAEVRTWYIITLKYDGGEWADKRSWTMTSIEFFK